MENILEYLRTYIDDSARIEPDAGVFSSRLPLAAAALFAFYRAEILGETVLLLKPLEAPDYSRLPARLQQIEDKLAVPAAVVLDEISPYMIKKLLKSGTAFIVPGKQLYLPFLALQVRTEAKLQLHREVRRFSPGTQMVYLAVLYADSEEFSSEELVQRLHVSAMTVSRALGDLHRLGLLDSETVGKTGRKKIYYCRDQKEYFHRGRAFLDDPVRETVMVQKMPESCGAVKSNLTALSTLTMLSEPEQPYFALPSRCRSVFDGFVISCEQALAEKCPAVQLMKYDVTALSRNGCLDPVSLMLSLTEKDERIQMAVDEMMAGFSWYESGEEEW